MVRTILVAALALALSGCTYDYLQRTDRVAYGAGNAVRANLVRETINPSYETQYKKTGLGKNGAVVPAATLVAPSPTN